MAHDPLNVPPNRLLEAARDVLALLNGHGFPACAIGGLAVLRWGQPRLTQDVDVSVLAPFGEEDPILDFLLSHLSSRRPDAKAFAKTYRVLLLTAVNGVPVDVGLAALPFEREALDRAMTLEWTDGIAFPVCSADDLIIYKLAAGRRHDLDDMEGVVKLQWRTLDVERIRRRTRELSDMLDGADLLTPFERALAKAQDR